MCVSVCARVLGGAEETDRRTDHIPPRKEGSCWDIRCPWASLVLARELAEDVPLCPGLWSSATTWPICSSGPGREPVLGSELSALLCLREVSQLVLL